ncbi:MAG: hypothetical protein VCA36_03800 [Opitutales bacterium]
MNKKLLVFLAVLVLGLISFFLWFGGINGFVASWQSFSNSSTWMPFSPYGNRVVEASKLTRFIATNVTFEDQCMFWKGQGAVAVPKLNSKGELEHINIIAGGYGYGPEVTARIAGAGSRQFELGETTVRNGRIIAVEIARTGKWYGSPRIFFEDDKLPFSGTAEIKYRTGQIMERRHYLEGEMHGKWSKWKRNGIPLFEKEYVHGLKEGTHMYWYGEPSDPKDYKPTTEEKNKPDPDKKTYVSFWVEVNVKVKEVFKGKNPSQQELNEWVVEEYKAEGGSFGPRRLEHFEANLPHGLFEGYDKRGNKIFKDEYEEGKRTKHKAFDPGGSS